MNSADQSNARAILQDYLAEVKITQSQLALKAGLNRSIVSRFLKGEKISPASALKLNRVLNLSDVDRRTFLKSLGVLALASLPHLSLGAPASLPEEESLTFDRGMRLFVKGMDVAQNSWEEALQIFLQAERAFGPASTQAARAACEAIQQLINLGRYEQANQEIQRVQSHYERELDSETRTRLNSVAGWLAYYEGNLEKSKKRFENCLEIARLAGVERLGDGANHFLGKIYCAYGQMNPGKADFYFHEAETHFRTSFRNSQKRGSDGSQAFEVFRYSQLLQARGELLRARSDCLEARRLRNKARQMFGNPSGGFYIDVAEAKLALEEGGAQIPIPKVERALQGWAHEKYARGISNAIAVLALADYQESELAQALELSIASLCIYPPQGQWKIQQLWSQVEHMNELLIHEEGGRKHYSLVRRIYELAQEKAGYFSYLDCISGDRSNIIPEIFRRLGVAE